MHAGTTQRNDRLSLPFLTPAFCSWVVSECSRDVDVHIREKLNDVQRFFTTDSLTFEVAQIFSVLPAGRRNDEQG